MTSSPSACALLLLTAAGLAGCGAGYTVVRQSGPPAALHGANQITADADFSQATMDGLPISQAIGALGPDDQASMQGSLNEMQQTFVQELANRAPVAVGAANGPAAPGELRVTMRVVDIVRGGHGPFSAPTRLHVRVVVTAGGQVTDEIDIARSLKWTITTPSSAQRLRLLSAQMARYTASFIERELGR